MAVCKRPERDSGSPGEAAENGGGTQPSAVVRRARLVPKKSAGARYLALAAAAAALAAAFFLLRGVRSATGGPDEAAAAVAAMYNERDGAAIAALCPSLPSGFDAGSLSDYLALGMGRSAASCSPSAPSGAGEYEILCGGRSIARLTLAGDGSVSDPWRAKEIEQYPLLEYTLRSPAGTEFYASGEALVPADASSKQYPTYFSFLDESAPETVEFICGELRCGGEVTARLLSRECEVIRDGADIEAVLRPDGELAGLLMLFCERAAGEYALASRVAGHGSSGLSALASVGSALEKRADGISEGADLSCSASRLETLSLADARQYSENCCSAVCSLELAALDADGAEISRETLRYTVYAVWGPDGFSAAEILPDNG